jgi:hypothetical protein
MEKFQEVWYACYGSNLKNQRFDRYIHGGTAENSSLPAFGSTDKRPISDSRPFVTHWELHFGRQCGGWQNKGVAFLNHAEATSSSPSAQHAITSGALCRIYKISFDQFVDVFLQENGGDPFDSEIRTLVKSSIVDAMKDLNNNESKVISDGIPEDRWYRRLVQLETVQRLPVVTFTSDIDVDFGEPSDPYLQTIARGLLESRHSGISKEQLAEYLARTAKKDFAEVKKMLDDEEKTQTGK